MNRFSSLLFSFLLLLAAHAHADDIDAPANDDGASSVEKVTFEYAEKNSQKLHLDRFIDTSVKGSSKRPVIIFSMGGGWEGGGRGDMGVNPFITDLAAEGYVIGFAPKICGRGL